MADQELDPSLVRTFAESRSEPEPDAAFLARVRQGVAGVERRRRMFRGLVVVGFVLGVLAVTPWVVVGTLLLVELALSPAGAMVAMGSSVVAAGFALKRGMA